MTMPAAALDAPSAAPIADASGVSARIFTDLISVEPLWRALEGRAVLSPYQRLDWIKAYRAAGFEPDARSVFAVLFADGQPIALLPLDIVSRFGLRTARIIGMPISNMDNLVFDPAHRDKLTPQALRKLFAALKAEAIAVDVMSFHCLFKDWQGVDNPLLAFPHAPAPNRLYFEPLDPLGASLLPKHRRKNIRYSRRKLEAEFGPLKLITAASRREVEALQGVFLAQRTRRFAEMGVENIFASPSFRRFFADLATSEIGQDHPALVLHALYAGDSPLATSIGACTATHYSHYMNSTADGPAARYSIIGVMLTLLLDDIRARGMTSFDIGLGDFDYKADWSTPHDVYDCLVPLTARGALGVPLLSGARWAKRTIKQTPALWTATRRLRAALVRLRKR